MSYSRIKVKVCGMTEADQVQQLVELGVDAVGMILHADSPRSIDLKTALAIRSVVPAFVSLVGVFVDADEDTVNLLAERAQLDLIQLHGKESDEFGSNLVRPFIKAIRARDAQQVSHEITKYPSAQALLLDPYVSGQHGGTGKQLDISMWPKSAPEHNGRAQKLILAGGLSKENIKAACRQFSPYAVDLNSGVESQPGINDLDEVRAVLTQLGR